MSRAIHIDASERDVTGACTKQGARITAIESLSSGGTRVVLSDPAAADALRKTFGKKVITGAVQRQPTRLMRA